MVVIIGFALFMIVMIIVAIAQKKAAEARTAALAETASRLGLDFYPSGLAEPDRGFWGGLFTPFSDSNLGHFLVRFEGFKPFGEGHSYSVSNLICGRKEGIDWYLFDYMYKTTQSTGKSTQTVPHPTGVVAARIPVVLPVLSLSPENVLTRVGNFLGMKELTFELEEFNKRYFIRGADPKAAYDVLHPQAIEYLMSLPVHSWQLAGPIIVIDKPGYFDPFEMQRVMHDIDGFIKQLPAYVKADRSFQSTWATPLD